LSYKIVLTYPTDSDPPTNPIKTVDNIQGALSVGGNLIPSADNVFTIGSPTASFANLYLGPNHAPVLDATSGNFGYYALIAAETAVSAVITDYSYPNTPWIDPRRYGADPTGSADSTVAIQTACNVAAKINGTVILPGIFSINALLVVLNGNQSTASFSILGFGSTGSQLIQRAPIGANGLLQVEGLQTPVVLENFSITLLNTTTNGIFLNAVDFYTIRRVYMSVTGGRCIWLNGCINGTIEDCYLGNGTFGVYARSINNFPPNLTRIVRCTFAGNSSYAVDYDGGSELHVIGCDMEGNGDPTGVNTSTGAIHIGPNINCFPTFGFAKVWMENNWIEGNHGGWSIQVDANTVGAQTNISIRGGHVISAPTVAGINQSLRVSGCERLLIEDFYSPSNNDTWSITATFATLRNILVAGGISPNNITYPDIVNYSTSNGNLIRGQSFSFTGTLTGVNSTVTGNFIALQQGNLITLIFPTINGTSNTTSMTVTGMNVVPNIIPTTDRTTAVIGALDNGANVGVIPTISATGGVISFTKLGGNFTSSGTKGITPAVITYIL
jgi:hypothetical protein